MRARYTADSAERCESYCDNISSIKNMPPYSRAHKFRNGDKQVNGEDEKFAHGANVTTPAIPIVLDGGTILYA